MRKIVFTLADNPIVATSFNQEKINIGEIVSR